MTSSGSQGGLTLLELVVVLAILSVLGTVMLTQTAGLTSEARYQQTVRTLEELDEAVLGRQPFGLEDPTGVLPGFVADMGRLPQAVAGLALSELWEPGLFAANDRLYGLRAITGLDNELDMLSGWRGPYVRLPVGASQLRDGWNADYVLTDTDGLAIDLADPIGAVRSGGSGTADPADPFNLAAPLAVVFEDVLESVDRASGVLAVSRMTVRFTLPDSASEGNQGIVRVYGVDDGRPALLYQSELFSVVVDPPGAALTEDVPIEFEDPLGVPLVGLRMPKGPKLLVAYQIAGSIAAVPTVPPDPAADLTTRAKSVLSFTMPAGGLTLPSPLVLEGR
ncbi:MAG: prepilin-type N-terminal cleavage/methylation domain-containing protein [Planctomycetota bacterium]